MDQQAFEKDQSLQPDPRAEEPGPGRDRADRRRNYPHPRHRRQRNQDVLVERRTKSEPHRPLPDKEGDESDSPPALHHQKEETLQHLSPEHLRGVKEKGIFFL